MKFGLRIPSFALPKIATLQEMGAYLRRAEDLGFETATCIDHMLPVPPATVRSWLEPMVLMAALAGVTRTIKLGPMGVTLPFRNPVYFAKEWATFDHMTGGRAIFGIAVGWNDKEYATMGIPRNERGRRMNELVEAITALFGGENVSYHGKYYKFDNITLEPKPLQGPMPPIWMPGGTQPFERIYGQTVRDITPVLRRIAKYASVWIPHSPSTPEMVRGDWEKMQMFMKEYGRKPGALTKAYCNFAYVLKKGEKPESAIPKFSMISAQDLDFWRNHYLVGDADEVAGRICARVEAFGGCEHIILNPVDWSLEQLELMAGEVLPRVMKGLKQ
jgi:alkanesulfonate monooxygenase SsuD/methylene tetrahydromethanopterin reductase-like flavin-dependent oxidoreductase (luciferase family)